MATESVASDPTKYGAKPVLGNYTGGASMHLWCAHALACVVASPDAALQSFNDDIQAAVRYLLQKEVERAQQAQTAGAQ